MSEKKQRVLVICLGNTCRSPIAEAIFQDYIDKAGIHDKWEVESAALKDYHTGEPPNDRAMAILRQKGLNNYTHKAKLITNEDFKTFDWILGMDNQNISQLKRIKPKETKAKIELLGKMILKEILSSKILIVIITAEVLQRLMNSVLEVLPLLSNKTLCNNINKWIRYKITNEDFKTFDWILGMDNQNISQLKRIKPKETKAKIELLGKYDPQGDTIIKDPYCDNHSRGFAKAYEQCVRSVASFIEQNAL